MTKVLELRENLQSFYGKYELYIKPAVRFFAALTAFILINGNMGYMKRLNHPAIALVLALLCAFLPINAVPVLSVILILVHLSALSLEACVVALLLFLLMFFMYFRFAPRDGYSAVLTPVLCRFGIPQVMPVSMGLLRGPYSSLSMVCGIVTYYLLAGIRSNEGMLSTPADEKESISKFTLVLQQVIGNKEMYLFIAAFLLTAILVYIIRRQSIDHAWTIAIGAGNAVNLAVLLVGSFVMENTGNIPWILLGTGISVIVAYIMEFFLYNLDYSRVERVQFEDDEYYYFVKAVPKVYVSAKDKKVKRINSTKRTTINKRQLAQELDIDQDLLDD